MIMNLCGFNHKYCICTSKFVEYLIDLSISSFTVCFRELFDSPYSRYRIYTRFFFCLLTVFSIFLDCFTCMHHSTKTDKETQLLNLSNQEL